MTHIARLLSPPVGASLMDQHLWIPFALAIALMGLRLLFIWIMPETLPSEIHLYQSLNDRRDQTQTDDHAEASSRGDTSVLTEPSLLTVKKLLSHVGLVVIFASFIVKRIAFSSESLTFQYASETTQKKLSQTVWLRISSTTAAALVLSIILPLISQLCPWRSPQKDLYNARGSMIIAALGFLVIFGGQSFVILCLGEFLPTPR